MVTLQRWAARATLALTFALAPMIAAAQTLVRDAEIEYALQQVAQPILQAAGLPSSTRIFVILDSSLNAFVVDNKSIFFHSGLLLKLDTPAKVQAVIAHEAAHITGGHITRRMTNLESARNAANLGIALAAIAAVSGSPEAAHGIALGSVSTAQRNFLSHTRAEEASADQSGVRYLSQAGIPPSAMRDVLDIFRGQEALSAGRQDPYLRSHPLTRDRLRALDGFITAYTRGSAIPTDITYWYERLRGKLSAYTRSPKWTLSRLNSAQKNDVYYLRQTVAFHRQSRTKEALTAIDKAIAQRPNDPYLYDMKAQILIETRAFSAAATTYSKAASLAPNNSLLLAGLGRAYLANGQISKARSTLERARAADYRNAALLRDLAVAYAKTNAPGMAALVTAERYALLGRMDDAGLHAKRATALLGTGTGPWQRAQDVLIASERAAKRR